MRASDKERAVQSFAEEFADIDRLDTAPLMSLRNSLPGAALAIPIAETIDPTSAAIITPSTNTPQDLSGDPLALVPPASHGTALPGTEREEGEAEDASGGGGWREVQGDGNGSDGDSDGEERGKHKKKHKKVCTSLHSSRLQFLSLLRRMRFYRPLYSYFAYRSIRSIRGTGKVPREVPGATTRTRATEVSATKAWTRDTCLPMVAASEVPEVTCLLFGPASSPSLAVGKMRKAAAVTV